MVIVPTEKQFDWQHAPLMLIVIVLLNILIFFLYQSGDAAKFDNGLNSYLQEELLPLEWPLYLDYIKATEGDESFEELKEQADSIEPIEMVVTILMDRKFTEYLNDNGRNLISDANYGGWYQARFNINQSIDNLSSFRFGLIPSQVNPLTIFTHQFMHGDVMHLLGNLFFLIICGFAVEAALGHLRFLLFYLISGVVGGMTHALISPDIDTPLIGASGAISGVMAMYLGVFRLKKIEFFYWFFIFVGYFRAPALLILPFYIGKEIYEYYGTEGASVAFMAHAGGFAAGAFLTLGTFALNRNLINEEYIEEDQLANPYQEKLAKVFNAIEKFQFNVALRSLNEMIEEFGANFELILIRYNLLKIDEGEEFQQTLLTLLAFKGSSDAQFLQQEKVWNENPEIQTSVDEKYLMQLALSFANDKQFDTAEKIFKQIVSNKKNTDHKQTEKDHELGKLALRMAKAADDLKYIAKKRTYQKYAESVI